MGEVALLGQGVGLGFGVVGVLYVAASLLAQDPVGLGVGGFRGKGLGFMV